jgi:hypothetical protein
MRYEDALRGCATKMRYEDAHERRGEHAYEEALQKAHFSRWFVAPFV